MSAFMMKLGIMSIQATVIIGIVFLTRWMFSKLHVAKKHLCILWVIPYLTMICPWKPASIFSFWNTLKIADRQMQQIPLESFISQNVNASDFVLQQPANNIIQNGYTGIEAAAVNAGKMLDIYSILFVVWLVGIAVILIYFVVSYIKLKSKLICSIPFTKNIYWAEEISTPFVLGIIKPKIYFPISMQNDNITYILEHEKTHVRRYDYVKKPVALLINTIHWFNPIAWLAFVFLTKDMEMVCDEETILRIGEENRREYAELLLNITVGKRNIFSVPLAFGEKDIKSRIKNIVQRKKAWKVVTATAMVFILFLGLGFLTEEKRDADIETMQSEAQTPTEEKEASKTNVIRSAKQLATEWAEAFCSRDGEKIANLASEEVIEQLKERGMLIGDKESISFVKSSPWPYSLNSYSYSVQKIANSYTEILYYAFDGEKGYVTVWLETIHYDMMADKMEVLDETLEYMEDIDNYSDFIRAYPGYSRGVVAGTYMDYLLNGCGEALNGSALAEPERYAALFQPESAAIQLLNLANDLEAFVRTEAENGVIVRILIEGGELDIPMIQPYGKDGIWIVRGEGSVFGDDLYVTESDGHRAGYKEAILHGYDNFDENSPEAKALAQRALRELYDLTGTQIEECWYQGGIWGIHFGQTKSDIEHSRFFYSRYYGNGAKEYIQNVRIVSRRRFWFSPVDMYTTPEFEMLTDAEKVVWYVTHCGSYNGKKVKEIIQPYDFEISAWHVIMEDDTTYEVHFDTEANIVEYITGPYPDSNIQH